MAYISKSFIMHTFFDQFLGGQTTQDCEPKIEQLRHGDSGVLLGYNVEATLDGSPKAPELILRQTQSVLESVDAQARLSAKFCGERASDPNVDTKCWVRIKVTGLVNDPSALYHGSNAILATRRRRGLDMDVPYPGLPHDGDWQAALSGEAVTAGDRDQLVRLRGTLEAILSRARDKNVRVVIDAEQTWYQPVIDALTDELMQKYNKLGGPATCIASFQAYLRRYPQLLEQQLQRAEAKGYRLVFKQVRGAYIVTEEARWKRDHGDDSMGPIWPNKEACDKSYNDAMDKSITFMAKQIKEHGQAKFGAVFATHNSHSIDKGIQLLEETGLATRPAGGDKLVLNDKLANSVTFAQLYGRTRGHGEWRGMVLTWSVTGMKDDLTNRITGSIRAENGLPIVIKVRRVPQISCAEYTSTNRSPSR